MTAALLIYLTYALLRPERFCASDGQGRRQGRKALAQEYDRLRALMQHAGKVLTHKFLLGELWDHLTDAEFLRVYVRQLRRRSRPIPSDRNTS